MNKIVSNKILQIKNQFIENKNSHIFLIETNDVNLTFNDIKKLIIEIITPDNDTIYQVENETFLENFIVKPDGKNIKKEQVLELQKYINNKPIFNEKKFYTIFNMETMNEISQNKMLKTIEEPPEGIIGFLLTENSDSILSTIKSRCEYLNITYNKTNSQYIENNESLSITNDLIRCIENKNILEFNLIIKNNLNTMVLETIIKNLQRYYSAIFNLKNDKILDKNIITLIKNNNNLEKIIKKNKVINSLYNKLSQNITAELLLELLYLELERI